MEHKIKDQKVFVKLSSVTKLQDRYRRALDAQKRAKEAKASTETLNHYNARVVAFQEAIAVLELPIQ
jgi:hypothetical protein